MSIRHILAEKGHSVITIEPESPAEKKSNDSKGLHSSPSAASMDSKADQRRLTVKALGSRGLPTLKLPNQRCQAQRFESADFLFGRALTFYRKNDLTSFQVISVSYDCLIGSAL